MLLNSSRHWMRYQESLFLNWGHSIGPNYTSEGIGRVAPIIWPQLFWTFLAQEAVATGVWARAKEFSKECHTLFNQFGQRREGVLFQAVTQRVPCDTQKIGGLGLIVLYTVQCMD